MTSGQEEKKCKEKERSWRLLLLGETKALSGACATLHPRTRVVAVPDRLGPTADGGCT